MNKIILGCVGLLLIFAVPALAEVTITATQVSGNEVEISYSGATAGNPVRAFALDITLDDPAAKIVSVTAAKRGISTSGAPGHGIFPASFARVINPADPNWNDADYTPVALQSDLPADTQPGIDSNGVTVELGSLYDGDANKPLTGSILLTVKVDAPEMAIVDLDILGNASRGGVVMEDGTSGTIKNGTTVYFSHLCANEYAQWLAYGGGNPAAAPANWRGSCFKCGDADNNTLVTFGDVIYVYQLLQAASTTGAGDVSMNGLLTFGDVIQVYQQVQGALGCAPCPMACP